ncbi:low-density lipoprotein receptor-related protein 2 [Elysia marginata]|uniref:Low-density lipoprotein receptor-related protein 2 n=1 Tax=Elysia marginata TaxID=1093978 RepID=A0AAV4ID40_9GAST|nr:low-density lipoprotein receptor-related protein 2 [Elysia marginata]
MAMMTVEIIPMKQKIFAFRCDDGQCIPYDIVCNKNPDCSDESDEQHCNINECRNIRMNQCEHRCIDTLTSFRCECNSGFQLMSDRRACRGEEISSHCDARFSVYS